jgi:hypothetical protein
MLKKFYRKSSGRKEWALVSIKDPSKVLRWYGQEKPSVDSVSKDEQRIGYFKHQKGK